MTFPPPPELIGGGAALLGAVALQTATDPITVPGDLGGWVVFVLLTLGLGGVLVWAVRKWLEDFFAAQAEERRLDMEERTAHKTIVEGQIMALRDDVQRIVAQRDALITEVIKDLRADRDFYRTAFLDERKRANECRPAAPVPAEGA